MTGVESASDIEAIKIVMARYFRYMDTKQWEELRNLFMPDVTMSAPDDVPGKAPTIGADHLSEVIRTVLNGAVSIHRGFMPEVQLIDVAFAKAVWAMEDVVSYPDDTSRNFSGSGHYLAEYRRISDGWKIQSLILRRLRLSRGASA
jgi:hypothetical protein